MGATAGAGPEKWALKMVNPKNEANEPPAISALILGANSPGFEPAIAGNPNLKRNHPYIIAFYYLLFPKDGLF